MKRIMIILLTLLLALSFTACIDPSEDGSDVTTITVKMNIDYSAAGDEDLPDNVKNYKLTVEDSATILQILEAYAQQEDVEVTVDKSSTHYVTSIHGVEQGDASGWIYTINGESTTQGAAEYVPADGDVITWEYINF